MREWLRTIRKEKQMSQASVARGAGISTQLYSRTELSNIGPSVKTAKRIASVLGFDWTKFYE